MIVGGFNGLGVRVRRSSLQLTAPDRDLIDVANGSLTFEDLLSVLLGFALSYNNQNGGEWERQTWTHTLRSMVPLVFFAYPMTFSFHEGASTTTRAAAPSPG